MIAGSSTKHYTTKRNNNHIPIYKRLPQLGNREFKARKAWLQRFYKTKELPQRWVKSDQFSNLQIATLGVSHITTQRTDKQSTAREIASITTSKIQIEEKAFEHVIRDCIQNASNMLHPTRVKLWLLSLSACLSVRRENLLAATYLQRTHTPSKSYNDNHSQYRWFLSS